MSADAVEAVLVAEFGRSRTRTYLVDVIDGEYRFLARGEAVSTVDAPNHDLIPGLQAAVQQIEHVAGRKLLRRDSLLMPQTTNGDGIDSFVAVANVGDPLRVVIFDAGATAAEVKAVTDAMRRQEAMVYTVTTPGRGVKLSEWSTQQSAIISSWQAHLAVFVTGPAPHPDVLNRMMAVIRGLSGAGQGGLTRLDMTKPPLLVLAIVPDSVALQLNDQLGARVSLKVLDEPPSTNLTDRLLQECAKLIDSQATDRVGGYRQIDSWAGAPVISRQRAASLVTHYLSRTGSRRVVLVDVEEAIGLFGAGPDLVGSAVLGDIDLGLGAPNLVKLVGAPAIMRWLPFPMSEEELLNWVLNRSMRPLTIATSGRDWLIEQALAREAIVTAAGRLDPLLCQGSELLVGSHRLFQWGDLRIAASVLLDAIQPSPEYGAVTLALDSLGLLPALGALAQTEPTAAASVLERDGLLSLGTCLVVQGGQVGQRVVSGVIRRESGQSDEFEVRGGSMVLLPLGPDESASVRLTLESRASMGTFNGGQTVQFEAPTHVRGGAVGLIVDARTRPLHENGRPSPDQMREWLTRLGVKLEGAGI